MRRDMAFRMLSASRRIGRGGLNFFLFASFDDDCNHTSDAIQFSRLSCTVTLLFVARNGENPISEFVSIQYISHYRSLMCKSRLLTQSWHSSNALTWHILSFMATRDSSVLSRDFDFWQRKEYAIENAV